MKRKLRPLRAPIGRNARLTPRKRARASMTIRSATYIGTVALLSQLLLAHGCGSNNPSTIARRWDERHGGRRCRHARRGYDWRGRRCRGQRRAPARLVRQVRRTPRRPVAQAAQPARRTLRRPVALPAITTATSSGGSTGASTGAFDPLCSTLLTAAGAIPTKAGVCTATDSQLCYKTCGPKSIGFKSETCSGGAYQEQSGCSFPTGIDYSCYKIPSVIDPSCPTTVPQASQPCSVWRALPARHGGYQLTAVTAVRQTEQGGWLAAQ